MEADSHPLRWRTLGLLAIAELLGMSLWFAASAVSTQLAAEWSLSASQTGWLTTIVQLGFVAGTAVSAMLNLADVIPSKRLFAVSALAGAAVNAAMVASPSYELALVLRFFTGFFLAGVYPPAMKMIATWFRSQRGLAIGTIAGALTIGKATPYLVHALPDAGVAAVVLTASGGAALRRCYRGGLLDGPYPFAPRPFFVGTRRGGRANSRMAPRNRGYLGHMFELYAFWTGYQHTSPQALTLSNPYATTHTGLSFAHRVSNDRHGGGGVRSGSVALRLRRKSRERLVTIALVASGACCLVVGFLFGASLWMLAPLALFWGFFVVADSAQFSALVTESVPSHAVGTALTIQTSLGFLLTMVTIQAFRCSRTRSAGNAFVILALGPACRIGQSSSRVPGGASRPLTAFNDSFH